MGRCAPLSESLRSGFTEGLSHGLIRVFLTGSPGYHEAVKVVSWVPAV